MASLWWTGVGMLMLALFACQKHNSVALSTSISLCKQIKAEIKSIRRQPIWQWDIVLVNIRCTASLLTIAHQPAMATASLFWVAHQCHSGSWRGLGMRYFIYLLKVDQNLLLLFLKPSRWTWLCQLQCPMTLVVQHVANCQARSANMAHSKRWQQNKNLSMSTLVSG